MFKINELLNYDDIVIQCHNIPDPDTIASAFAIYKYLQSKGKASRIIYGGFQKISKANICELIETYSIPIEYVSDLNCPDILVLVDCQYGAGNVKRFDAKEVAVIDHHKQECDDMKYLLINSSLGSCSTIVWDILRKEGYDFQNNSDVSTVLYYGLYTDTNSFAEIYHPLDKDMRDMLGYDANIIRKLKNSNLTLEELEIAGVALTSYKSFNDKRYAIFKSEPCDPNILGFISDLALQVNTIDVCIVYSEITGGAKLSLRSCLREVMASELAEFITGGVGSGGGRFDKAGGFINGQSVSKLQLNINDYIDEKVIEYFNSYQLIYSEKHNLDITLMKKYRKKKIPVAYVRSTDVFPEGTQMVIRTLEGDTEAVASENIYIMIGILGEAYPIKKEKFLAGYEINAGKININAAYTPNAKNKFTGDSVSLLERAETCVAKGEVIIFAMPTTQNTKVFTTWNVESYMSGKAGDFLAVRADDINDVYLIRQDIFYDTYEECLPED